MRRLWRMANARLVYVLSPQVNAGRNEIVM